VVVDVHLRQLGRLIIHVHMHHFAGIQVHQGHQVQRVSIFIVLLGGAHIQEALEGRRGGGGGMEAGRSATGSKVV
jgi:hypothetical protein